MELGDDIYRLLFELNPRPTWVFDRDTRRILAVNDTAIRVYGWSREEFLAMTLDQLRPPTELPAFHASYVAAKPGPTYARVGRHWKKSGEVIDVHVEITTFTLGGRVTAMSSVVEFTGIAEAERRFRLLVEHSAEAIALTAENGVIEYVSPAAERILGYPVSEVIGRPSLARVHPEDAPTWSAPVPGATSSFVARAMHRDGSWRWIEVMTTNLTHDPAVRAFVSNYRDVTARKQAEQAQINTQRRLEYLLSATSAITYSSRPGGHASFISASLRTVLGYTPEQFYQHPGMWLANIHPDDLARVELGMRELRAEGEHTFEYRFRHADGSFRWTRDVARLERDQNGEPREIVGYWTDITEQRKAEESLRRSEANFRALSERSPSAIVVHRDGRHVYVNPAMAALLGHSSAELVDQPALDYIHPDDRDRVRQRMAQVLVRGETPAGEVRMLRRDGSVFVLEVEGIVLDFDGKPSTVVIGRDVTERRELFARMALADRMLTVGTLAAGVAHEINNPLAYASTNLEVLASELACVLANVPTRLPRSELPAIVADAREGVARVSAIVRGMRALARPDDDSRGPVDVVAVLASSIKMASNEIRHRARVVESYAPGLPAAFAHASRLGQVFLNLLINAAQAIPEGRADQNEIRVRAAAAADGRQVRVEIQDTGMGIPPSLMRRIFDPFFTTKEPGVGMGLGLAISHQIVRALDGEITVESEPGFGTTFRVTLPVATLLEEDKPPPVATATRSHARILLIDDEVALGRSLCALLRDEHDVVAVTCARDALERLRAGERFDVILCDLMMPDVSGIELYEQMPATDRERIVFMTGGAFTPQAREFLARCDRPRLEKPFSELELRDAIERVRSTRDTRRDPPAAPP